MWVTATRVGDKTIRYMNSVQVMRKFSQKSHCVAINKLNCTGGMYLHYLYCLKGNLVHLQILKLSCEITQVIMDHKPEQIFWAYFIDAAFFPNMNTVSTMCTFADWFLNYKSVISSVSDL